MQVFCGYILSESIKVGDVSENNGIVDYVIS